MASINITIPDPVLNRVLDAIAVTRGYNPNTDGTKALFAKNVLIRVIKDAVKEYEGRLASATAVTQADSDIQPT